MPSQPRLILSQSYYHIMTRGNNRNKIFLCDADYQAYLERISIYKKELPFDLFHYCLMPNHVHMLVRTKNASDFSKFMKKIDLSYFHYYKQNYGWTGHFWQGRFKSQPVGKDEYFIQCGKYIELNPVRARIVEEPEEYLYSSYSYYTFGRADNLVTEDILYSGLGDNAEERQEKYRKLVIGDDVNNSYDKPSWGSNIERYKENKKVANCLKSKKDESSG